jgi:protein subunit release factor A
LENYDSITTKFVDSEGKIRSSEVLNDKNAFEQIESNSADLKKINDAVKEMMDESSTENTLENMKVKIENKIIGYYNDNFMTYIDDMTNKIKEKLSLFSLQNTD